MHAETCALQQPDARKQIPSSGDPGRRRRNASDAMVLPACECTAVLPEVRPTADRPLPPEPFVTLLRREPQQIAVDRMSE